MSIDLVCSRLLLLSVPALGACVASDAINTPVNVIVMVDQAAAGGGDSGPEPPVAERDGAGPTGNSELTLALEPDHLWRFDETSGHVVRDEIGGEHGKTARAVDRIPGLSGNAVALSGNARSFVDLGWNVGQVGRRNFTVSLWFRSDSNASNSELLSNRANGSHGNFFNLRVAGGKVVFELDEDTTGTNYVALTSQEGLTDGAWHRVVARRRGNRATLFIDGERVDEATSKGPINVDNGRSLQVGTSAVANEFGIHFRGDVDEVAIFDRALRDHELATLASSKTL